MKNRYWKTGLMSMLAALALFPTVVSAQDQGMGDMMFTAGTVMTTEGGEDWAWLQWMATDGALLKNRPMDIYWKVGKADALGTFSLKGRVTQMTDPRSISRLLVRGETLGENLENLEAAIDSLYSGAAPVDSLTLAEKLSAVIAGSQDNEELYNNLVFMGRAHPVVSMAIGQGAAFQIPAGDFSTFEVRDSSTAEVIGRLVLEAGFPVVLPAPGPIARVPETSPMGNLNIRLRWDIPTDLRRLSLLQFGYNLYRVEKYAATKWWGTTPTTAELLDYVDRYEAAKKVNRMPILVDAALASPTTWYAVDDNDGQAPGGTPFVDGEEYYYYLTALDLLGRDGDVSAPFLTFPCDRMAPSVPHDVTTRTISVYDDVTESRDQFVEISWDHDPSDADIARYYVYRFNSFSNMQASAASPMVGRISGSLVPASGAIRMVYEDHTLTSSDWSTTYWYTVRAEDDARCADNLSGNSAPVFGLLRDWEGPPAATGVVATIHVENPTVSFDTAGPINLMAPLNAEIACLRDPNLPITWAEFAWSTASPDINQATLLGRFYYPEGSSEVSTRASVSTDKGTTLFCRVGTSLGKRSEWVHYDGDISEQAVRFTFVADLTMLDVPVDDTHPGPHIWQYSPMFFPILTIPGVEGAETCRVYRRVDGGRRTLIYQGEMPANLEALAVEDHTGGAVNGGVICYYYQLFDEHGNAGPMVKICCFEAVPRVELPTPILESIDSTGEVPATPGMELNWFCTTPGIERFEVAVALDDGPLPSTFGTLNYELREGITNSMDVVVAGVTNQLNFGFYRTGRVGTTFGNIGSPLFVLNSTINLDRDYTIMVRAVGVAGVTSPWSNIETFRWSTVPVVGPEVPWPARGMPPVQQSAFHADFGAQYLDSSIFANLNDEDVVGIRIGEIPNEYVPKSQNVPHEIWLDIIIDPRDFLYTNAYNQVETSFPCVLYRYQLTNDLYRTVSGDVAQVSPLMEEMAWGIAKDSGDKEVAVIYDPFIAVSQHYDSSEPWGIYLIDTQPVVRGAKYQYLLMRFDEETKELDRVIPAGTVTIP